MQKIKSNGNTLHFGDWWIYVMPMVVDGLPDLKVKLWHKAEIIGTFNTIEEAVENIDESE